MVGAVVAQCFRRGESVGSGRDAFLAAVRPATGHRGLFEGVGVAVIADHDPGPVRSEAVPGDGDRRGGDDVDDLAAEDPG